MGVVMVASFSRTDLSTHDEKLTPSRDAAFLPIFSIFLSIVIDGFAFVTPVSGRPLLGFGSVLIYVTIKTDKINP